MDKLNTDILTVEKVIYPKILNLNSLVWVMLPLLDSIKVTWLSGNVNIFKDIEVNQTFNITEESSTLSNEDVNESKISFYPNPTSEVLNIESIKCLKNIEIYNSLGEKSFQSYS